MTGLYSINSPIRLFQKLAFNFVRYDCTPNEDHIYDVLFPLYHLREWIHPQGHGTYQSKAVADWTKEEKLYDALHKLSAYQIVRSLCNNAKHFNDEDLEERTAVLRKFRAGYGRCGDSLDVTHYLVDGIEIRTIFWEVYRVYFNYFQESDEEALSVILKSLPSVEEMRRDRYKHPPSI